MASALSNRQNCACARKTLQTQRGRTHGAGCVRQWFRTAEPLGERRYEYWHTHIHTHQFWMTTVKSRHFKLEVYPDLVGMATKWGWSGGGMVLGKPLVPGVLLIWVRVGQGYTALALGAGWGCLDIFSLGYHFSFLSPSLWETAQYKLKYSLKGP